MFKIIKKILASLFVTVFLVSISFISVSAEDTTKTVIDNNLKSVAETNGPYYTTTGTSMAAILGLIIQTFLGLLGIIFIILMIYAGYNWMTAAGEEAKIKTAQGTIKKAIIGLIIIVSAYAIYAFVFEKLLLIVLK